MSPAVAPSPIGNGVDLGEAPMSALTFHLTIGQADSFRTGVARTNVADAHAIQRRSRARAIEEHRRPPYPIAGDADRRGISLNSG